MGTVHDKQQPITALLTFKQCHPTCHLESWDGQATNFRTTRAFSQAITILNSSFTSWWQGYFLLIENIPCDGDMSYFPNNCGKRL